MGIKTYFKNLSLKVTNIQRKETQLTNNL